MIQFDLVVLLQLVVLYTQSQAAGSDIYYITTDSTSDLCTVQPCLILSEFAANSSSYLHSGNTALVFLPGTHYLSNVNLTVENVDNFVLKSENVVAQIKCTSDSHIYFRQSQCIHITNMEFIGCGNNNIVEVVTSFLVNNTKFEGLNNSGTALELIKTEAQFLNSTFVSNRKGSYRQLNNLFMPGFIGGAVIATSSTINISQSKFEDNGAADYGGAIFTWQNSIIHMDNDVYINGNTASYGGALFSYNSTVTMNASIFQNNTSSASGGVLLSIRSMITIEDSEFDSNSAQYSGGALYSSESAVTVDATEFYGNIGYLAGGALYISDNSTITIEASEFRENIADEGGVASSRNSKITIEASEFDDNIAKFGGVLFSESSTIAVNDSEFRKNSANVSGGALFSESSIIIIKASEFGSNSANNSGGVLLSKSSTITVKESEFDSNSAIWDGGVMYADCSAIILQASVYENNIANFNGGALYLSNSSILTIKASEFKNNSASKGGGALYSLKSNVTIGSGKFTENSSPEGAVILAKDGSRIQYYNDLWIHSNSAKSLAVVYLINSEFNGNYSGNITFSNNMGSMMALNGKITLNGFATIVNNRPNPSQTFHEGGAITVIQSDAFFQAQCILEHNHAIHGGAIYSTGSRLYVNGNVTMAHNTATGNGGGIYLLNSELSCQFIKNMSTLTLFNNTAVQKGGGLHAISSSLKVAYTILEYNTENVYYYNMGARVNFTKNAARFGGGLSLEANAKLYILKVPVAIETPGSVIYDNIDANATIFMGNNAEYGGAVYVDDDTNSGTCASDPRTECFFQVLALYETYPLNFTVATQCIYFSQNSAYVLGSTLYGGLLDRCAVSQFSEFYAWSTHDNGDIQVDGIAYFQNVSIASNISISSQPVRICFCTNYSSECTYQKRVDTKKGEVFTVLISAVDQMSQPINASIQAFLHFTESGLAEGQLSRKISAGCTNLTFNAVSPHDSETLTLYASDGPCKDAELSRAIVEIHFLPCICLIGLQVSGTKKTNCTCECHSNITEYMKTCDSHTGSLIKQPQSRAWISYINDTDLTGYLVYPNCPFDYYLSTSPPIYLNQPNGADAQCAFNRSSRLCGSCQPDLSLSLGSSRCLQCPNYWPALLTTITIAAILAGIVLVTLLLVLNMTVAIGTLNGVIFYANVVYANKSILLQFQTINIVTVFISWLNLDLGIDSCFFPEMDTYIKTWLQLAFPAYIIFLVILVISISSRSTKFSHLIGKKDPVATLATLILLSYSKLLTICFKSLSVGILEYPDGSDSYEMLWLPDATIKYLSGKHIPLFIAAVLILLVGLIYTALLFSWQWLLYLPRWRIFKWSRNPKIQTFIETCHKPYTPKHRYWTGLLLIVRIALYLVAATNVSNDPTVALTSITVVVCFIVLLKGFIVSRLYRKWSMDVLETFFCLK